MLKKKERLTKGLFDRSFSVGKRVHMPSLQLIYSQSDSFHGSVVVGKKVYKGAVQRNKLRRQLYAHLYQFAKNHPAPLTYIVIAKPYITKVSKSEVSFELRNALEKAVRGQ